MTIADRIASGDPTALDELDALHEGSPQGPWRFVAPRPTCSGGIWSGPAGGANILVTPNADEQDLALIVALRNAYPALVARVRALEAERPAAVDAVLEGLLSATEPMYSELNQVASRLRTGLEAAKARAKRAEADADRAWEWCESMLCESHPWTKDDPDRYERDLAAHAAAVAERDA